MNNYMKEKLFAMQDEKYADFQARLMPTIERARIIGVRTPILRAFAKESFGTDEAEAFLKTLPHYYYEENNLHAFLTEQIKDFDTALCEVNRFLPYIDNWATCDSFVPKAFKKNRELLLPEIKKWLKSDQTYTVRYGLGLLMGFFLDDLFSPTHLKLAAAVCSAEYYINMMQAWYFATALAKQYDQTVPFLTENRLSEWVHNKTIRKAIESYRISDEQKVFLRSLKR